VRKTRAAGNLLTLAMVLCVSCDLCG